MNLVSVSHWFFILENRRWWHAWGIIHPPFAWGTNAIFMVRTQNRNPAEVGISFAGRVPSAIGNSVAEAFPSVLTYMENPSNKQYVKVQGTEILFSREWDFIKIDRLSTKAAKSDISIQSRAVNSNRCSWTKPYSFLHQMWWSWLYYEHPFR